MNQLTTTDQNSMILDTGKMESVFRFAEIMSQAKISLPKHFQGNPADCMALVLQAQRWGMDPFAVAQQAFLVNGNLGFSAQLVNAVISSSKAIQGRFHYEYDWKQGAPNGLVKVGAVIAGEDNITWGEWLDTSKVTTKNSPLWKTNPRQQAAYLAMKYWARLYTPEMLLGVYTKDELDNAPIAKPERDITPQPEPAAATQSNTLSSILAEQQAQAVQSDTTPIDENHDPIVAADTYSKLMEGAGSIEDLEQFYDESIGRLRELYKHWKAAGDMDKANLCGDLSRTLQAVAEECKVKFLTEAGA